MTSQTRITYESLLALVEQLPEAQQKDLISHIVSQQIAQRRSKQDRQVQPSEPRNLDQPIPEDKKPAVAKSVAKSQRRIDWDDGRLIF